MCNAFNKAGWDVVLAHEGKIAGNRDQMEAFSKSVFKEQILVRTINWENKYRKKIVNRFLTRQDIKTIIENEKPDLVFTREPLFLRTIVQMKVSVIFESHNTRQHSRSRILHLFIKNEIKKVAGSNHFLCLFSISQALLNYWKNQDIPQKKLFAWHDGFDTSLFDPMLSKSQAREIHKLPLNKRIILYTGGLYRDREIENILKLAKSNPEHLFIIVGGPEKNKFFFERKALRMSIRNVRLKGFVQHKEIPEYLYAADILLALWSGKVPTINYCSPLKLFEYMAAGRLILAHDFPTIREVLEDGKDAILCQPDNFQSLNSKFTEAIKKIDDDTFGNNARRKAVEMFSWDTRVYKLLEFIKHN